MARYYEKDGEIKDFDQAIKGADTALLGEVMMEFSDVDQVSGLKYYLVMLERYAEKHKEKYGEEFAY